MYDGFCFETEEDSRDINTVMRKFHDYCVGQTNETYERYV